MNLDYDYIASNLIVALATAVFSACTWLVGTFWKLGRDMTHAFIRIRRLEERIKKLEP